MSNKGKMIEAVYAACLTSRATLVIFYLINRANQELTCFPSVKTIASECNMSSRTVQRALNDLEETGFLERESRFHDKGGQRSNLYKLRSAEEYVNKAETNNEKNISNVIDELKNTKKDAENGPYKIFENKATRTKLAITRIIKIFKIEKTNFLNWCRRVYDKLSSLEL